MSKDLIGDYPFPPSRSQLAQHERDMDRLRADAAKRRGITVEELMAEIEADDTK